VSSLHRNKTAQGTAAGNESTAIRIRPFATEPKMAFFDPANKHSEKLDMALLYRNLIRMCHNKNRRGTASLMLDLNNRHQQA
jgi:hypothetical protein